MENIYLGWANGKYYEIHDSYLDGDCKRCGRNRRECQKIIDTGKRCTEVKCETRGTGDIQCLGVG